MIVVDHGLYICYKDQSRFRRTWLRIVQIYKSLLLCVKGNSQSLSKCVYISGYIYLHISCIRLVIKRVVNVEESLHFTRFDISNLS